MCKKRAAPTQPHKFWTGFRYQFAKRQWQFGKPVAPTFFLGKDCLLNEDVGLVSRSLNGFLVALVGDEVLFHLQS